MGAVLARIRSVDPFFVLVVVVALALRLHDLDEDPFWIDEMRSVFRADGLPFFRSVRETFGPLDPPLGFAIEALARRAPFLSLEAGARLPMALAGTGEVALTWVLLRRFFGRRAEADVAVLLVAIAPFAIRYSQEARYYALGSMLHLLGWLLVLEVARGRRRLIWAWAIVSIIAVYTTTFAWIWVGLQFLVGVGHARRSDAGVRRWIAAGAAPVVAIVPWLAYEVAYWTTSKAELASSSFDVRFDPALAADIVRWLLGNGAMTTAIPIAALALAAVLSCRSDDRRVVVGAWAFVFVTVGVVVVAARQTGTYFAMRRVEFLVPVLVSLAAVGAVGLVRLVSERSRLAGRVSGAAVVLAVGPLLLGAVDDYYDSEKSDYRTAAAAYERRDPEAVVLGPVLRGSADWVPPIRRYLTELGIDQPIRHVSEIDDDVVSGSGEVLWIGAAVPDDPRFDVLHRNDLDELQFLAGDDSLDDFVIPVVVFVSQFTSGADLESQADLVSELPAVIARSAS